MIPFLYKLSAVQRLIINSLCLISYSVIYPGGSIPMHNHETIETYTILQGEGEMTVDGETQHVIPGDSVYIDHNQHHSLVNSGDHDLHVMYVYAPKMVVDHWAQELSGELK